MTLAEKLHKKNNELIDFCNSHESIVIYGAGDAGKMVWQYLMVEKIDCDGFFVSDGQEIKEPVIDGLPVKHLSELNYKNGKTGIIISISKKFQDELLGILKKQINVYSEDVFLQNMFFNRKPNEEKRDDRLINYEGYQLRSTLFGDYHYLEDLGIKHGTDKAGPFLHKYEFFFEKYIQQSFNMIELGVFKGASIRTFGEYFKNAKIYGVDIDPQCKNFTGGIDNIEVLIRDLGSPGAYDELKRLEPTIILDDASHMWSHQITALCELFPALKRGGMYILEDLSTSFTYWGSSCYDDASITAYDFVSGIAEVVTGHEYLRENNRLLGRLFAEEIEEIAKQIEMITFIEGSCLMIKR